jgi:transcriptional regulator with XRE-family HTH domain
MSHLDLQKHVGLAVRKLRRQRGLSQHALANIAGLSRTYVTEVEAGQRNLTLQTISRLADALGVLACDFFLTAGVANGEADEVAQKPAL